MCDLYYLVGRLLHEKAFVSAALQLRIWKGNQRPLVDACNHLYCWVNHRLTLLQYAALELCEVG